MRNDHSAIDNVSSAIVAMGVMRYIFWIIVLIFWFGPTLSWIERIVTIISSHV